MIGIIIWIVELGCIDISVDVLMMSSHLELYSRFRRKKVLHMFGYIKKHYNNEIVFDLSEPYVDYEDFKHEDWSLSIYREI